MGLLGDKCEPVSRCVYQGGAGARWRGAKGKKMGAPVILSTIKKELTKCGNILQKIYLNPNATPNTQ